MYKNFHISSANLVYRTCSQGLRDNSYGIPVQESMCVVFIQESI